MKDLSKAKNNELLENDLEEEFITDAFKNNLNNINNDKNILDQTDYSKAENNPLLDSDFNLYD